MTPRDQTRRRSAGIQAVTTPAVSVRLTTSGLTTSLLVDLGTTTITGVTAPAAPGLANRARYLGHPTMWTIALDASVSAALGSDLARIGYAFEPPVLDDGVFVDALGVTWLSDGLPPTPLEHPLAGGAPSRGIDQALPLWPDLVQVPNGWPSAAPDPDTGPRPDDARSSALTILDAPCPGLLETAFALRGSWAFLNDLAEDWRSATALLEWALEMNVAAYEQVLTALPASPDLILLGDDYGRSRDMLISAADFRAHVRPRLASLIARIRRLAPAAICFHSCGAIRPILGDLADLEIEVLNLDTDAAGMHISNVRRALSAATVLHGWTDLGSLGAAIRAGQRSTVRRLVADLARSMPAIAAPADALTTPAGLDAAVRGAALVSALSDLEIDWSRMDGSDAVPEEALDHAEEVARSITVPLDCGDVPRTLSRATVAAARCRPSPDRSPEVALA